MNNFFPFQGHRCGHVLVLYDLDFSSEEPLLPPYSLPSLARSESGLKPDLPPDSEKASDEQADQPAPALSTEDLLPLIY